MAPSEHFSCPMWQRSSEEWGTLEGFGWFLLAKSVASCDAAREGV